MITRKSFCPLHFNHPEIGATCIFDYMGIPPHTWIDDSEEELPLITITEDILQEIQGYCVRPFTFSRGFCC